MIGLLHLVVELHQEVEQFLVVVGRQAVFLGFVLRELVVQCCKVVVDSSAE